MYILSTRINNDNDNDNNNNDNNNDNNNKQTVDDFFDLLPTFDHSYLCLGNSFNIEGDFILSEVDQVKLSDRSCSSCGNFVYLDFAKILKPEQIR